MTIWIDNQTENEIFQNYEDILKDIVKACIQEENYPENIEVSISIVDNTEIQKLNNEFRNIDKCTDVLSFPMLKFENNNLRLDDKIINESINRDTNEIVLGDIIISIEKATSQANEFGHSLQREMAFLTAHSMFHLMGYDHEEILDENIMKQKQENVLTKKKFIRNI